MNQGKKKRLEECGAFFQPRQKNTGGTINLLGGNYRSNSSRRYDRDGNRRSRCNSGLADFQFSHRLLTERRILEGILLAHPSLKLLVVSHHFQSGTHVAMNRTTQLTADDFRFPDFNGNKPHPGKLPWISVLGNPHGRESKVVNHILGGNIDLNLLFIR